MKKMIDAEKFDLGDVLKRGLSVRDEIVNEFNLARSKFAKVNWQDELDAFKKSPVDTAQSYLNQVNEALRSRTEQKGTTQTESTEVKTEVKPTVTRKASATRTTAKSPRAKQSVGKKPATKKAVVKKATAKPVVARKAVAKKPVAKTTAPARLTSTKSKETRTTTKTGTAQ